MDRRRLASARLVFGVFTLLGLFSSVQAQLVTALYLQKSNSFGLSLLLNMSWWYAWALLVPFVLWLARRFPLDKTRWLRSLPMHLVGVATLTFAHVCLAELFVLFAPLLESSQLTYRENVVRSYVWSFDWNMAVYWAVIAFSHAARYHREVQERTVRASQLEARLAEARLEALQRQLHPHFLFNTLNSISSLMHRDVDAADGMLAQLSDLLRMALEQRGLQEVALKDELEFVGKYVGIEQARFRERCSVRFDIDPDTLDARVPNLVLQPIVENSVRHAVSTSVDPRKIEIRSRREGDMLRLEVRDDGPGLPAGSIPPARGVGLENTRARLEQLYGSSQRLRFSRPPAGGLVVTIEIPFRVAPVEDLPHAIEGVA
ncbi:MAG TPA: histidine kinase [Vicinamibacterales bacterium]|nr:histidine kinase [Vicinamibacterales bacterium]